MQSLNTWSARLTGKVGLAGTAMFALVVLLAIGGILQPRSLTLSAVLSLLPFIAILGFAAIGQHLVVQQRGLDISVAGIMSLATVIVTAFPPQGTLAEVTPFIVLTLLIGALAGLVNGIFVTYVSVPPLVTTIGTNALLIGAVLQLSGGQGSAAPPVLSTLALSRTLGIPNTIIALGVFVAVAWFILNRTMLGRRFLAVGISPSTATALALPVRGYQCATYALAGFCYALAGILLAGFLNIPGLYSGNAYILSTIAAVVVGGNPLNGGRSSVVATIIGCVFLTYLDQLVRSVGYPQSAQFIAQAALVLFAVGGAAYVKQHRRSGVSA